jgi:hypothetical protein
MDIEIISEERSLDEPKAVQKSSHRKPRRDDNDNWEESKTALNPRY